MSIRNNRTSGVKSQFPGTLSGVSKELWTSLARRAFKEDQTAVRSANEDGNMRVDVFSDETGIDTGLSTGYTFRGTPNYDIVITAGSLSLFRPSDLSTGLQGFWKLNDVVTHGGHTATPNGSPVISSDQFQFGGASGLFDGIDDYIAFADNLTDFNLTGNFTIEGFIYATANATKEMFNLHVATNNDVSVKLDASGRLQMTMENAGGGSGTLSATGATTVTTNTWHHFAFVRIGSVVYVYLDGVRDGSGTISGSFPTSGSWNVSVGAHKNDAGSTSNLFQGYIDELRISNGIARYDGNFTSPTSAFTYDGFTKLLLHMNTNFNDASGSTTAKDSTANANHLTPSGGPPVQSAEDYWNTKEPSADIESATNDDLSIDDASQTGLDVTTNWTLSAWVKSESSTTRYIMAKDQDLTGYGWGMDSFNVQFVMIAGTGYGIGSGHTFLHNKWYHVAVVYDGANSRLLFYYDGNLDKIITGVSAPSANSGAFHVGRSRTTSAWDGLMKDAAVWDTQLTPLQIKSLALGINLSTFAFRPDHASLPDATAYWKLNELSSGAGAVSRVDSSGNAHTLTDNNTVTTEGGYAEATGARFTTANTEFLTAADSSDWDFGTGDFSYATFVKIKQTGIWNALIAPTGTFVGSSDWFMVAIDDAANGGTLTVYTESTIATVSNTVTNFKTDTWYHIAVCRRSGVLYIYLDGVQIHSVANTVDIQSPGAIDLGHWFSGGTHYYANIVLSDTAIWKGSGLTAAQVSSLACGLPIQTQGIISYWKLNESSGTRVDSFGDNDLADNNTVGSAAGQVGTAADFERDNSEWLSITDALQSGLDITKDFTLMIWGKGETWPGNAMNLINKFTPNTGWSLLLSSTQKINVQSDAGSVAGTTTVSMAAWHHMAGVYTGAQLQAWLDSYVDGTNATTDDPSATSVNFRMGSNNDAGADAWDGLMDEAIVAARWFRPEEIKTVYNKGLNTKEATSTEIAPSSEGTVISTPFTASEIPTHALAIVNKTLGTGTITLYVSRVTSPGTNLADTTKWTEITENIITDLTKQDSGASCRWAAVITGDSQLDDIAIVFGKANE